MIPVEVWSADAVGLDLMLGSLALGACQVAVLAAGSHDAAPLKAQAGHGQAILSALGYGGEHLRVIEADADDWPGARARTVRLGAGHRRRRARAFPVAGEEARDAGFRAPPSGRPRACHRVTPAGLPAAIASRRARPSAR